MEHNTVRLKNIKPPKDAIAIVGMPGIGNVGKLVAEHLKSEIGAEYVGAIYSPHFPHNAIMLKNGRLRLVSNRIYLSRRKNQKQDIVIVTGDVQAVSTEGQYSVNATILNTLREKFNATTIYTIGGYNLGEQINGTPRVFGNATNKKMVEHLKEKGIIFHKSHGLIWGSAGLVVAFARMQKVDGACLMGETGMLEIDAGAAKSVIVALSKILNIKISTDNLDEIIKETEKLLKRMGGQHIEGTIMPIDENSTHRPSYIR